MQRRVFLLSESSLCKPKKKLLWFEGMQRNKKHQTIHKILHKCVTVTQERAFHPTMSIYHLLTNS